MVCVQKLSYRLWANCHFPGRSSDTHPVNETCAELIRRDRSRDQVGPTAGQVLSWLRGAENVHDQLDQLTEPERFTDKARVSIDVGAHAPFRYGAHDDAGDVAERLGFAHCAEQPWTVKHRHHEV